MFYNLLFIFYNLVIVQEYTKNGNYVSEQQKYTQN